MNNTEVMCPECGSSDYYEVMVNGPMGRKTTDLICSDCEKAFMVVAVSTVEVTTHKFTRKIEPPDSGAES